MKYEHLLLEREYKAMHKLPSLLTICFHPSLAHHARAKQQINKCLSWQNMLRSVPAAMSSKWRKNNIIDEMKWSTERSQVNASLKQNCCTTRLTTARWKVSTSQPHGFFFRKTKTLRRLS